MKPGYKFVIVAAASSVLGATVAEVIHAQNNTPPAYLIAEIRVTDPEAYKEYVSKVPAGIEAFGGRFLVRGGKTESLEGAEPAGRVAVIQFRSLAEAKQYWNSPAYKEIEPIRHRSATSRIFLAEGAVP
jgi:uncharacterized protein (DUF1330 family)